MAAWRYHLLLTLHVGSMCCFVYCAITNTPSSPDWSSAVPHEATGIILSNESDVLRLLTIEADVQTTEAGILTTESGQQIDPAVFVDDPVIVSEHPLTWLEAFMYCSNRSGYTLVSADEIVRGNLSSDVLANHSETDPLWTYGFVGDRRAEEVRLDRRLIIKYRTPDHSAYILCKNGNNNVTNCTFQEAKDYCRKRPGPDGGESTLLDELNRENVFYQMSSTTYIRYDFWINSVRETSFINDTNDNRTFFCLLLDTDGAIKLRYCHNKHRAACIKGTLKPVLRYINATAPQWPFPFYQEKTTPDNSHTTGTYSAKSLETTSGKSSPTRGQSSPTTLSAVISTPRSNSSDISPESDLFQLMSTVGYTVLAVGAAVLVIVVVMVICCAVRCRKKKTTKAHLASEYSETADSIGVNFKEIENYSEYADPDDTIPGRKAVARKSIGEGEYDTLDTDAKKKNMKPTGNVYSHVTIVGRNKRQSNTSTDSNVYDETRFGNQPATIQITSDIPGNTYGHVEINSSASK